MRLILSTKKISFKEPNLSLEKNQDDSFLEQNFQGKNFKSYFIGQGALIIWKIQDLDFGVEI